MKNEIIISEEIDKMIETEVIRTYEDHGGELTEEEFKDMLRQIILKVRKM